MKRTLKQASALLLALVLTVSLVGCGTTDNGGGTSTTAPSAGGATTSGSGGGDQNLGSTQAIRADRSLVTSADWPTYIDPGVGSKASDSTAFVNLYDTLLFPHYNGSSEPLVAERWEANDESTVYTFYLRDDVFFHSGNNVTANDVKFSMDRLLTMGEGYAYIFAGTVESTEVVDERTVRFNLSQPTGNFTSMIIRLYILDEKLVRENFDPSGLYGENGDYGKGWLMTHDAGSGPYQVKEMRTEEYLVMEQFKDYWRGWEDGAPETITMSGGIDATTGRTMMLRGELDFNGRDLAPEVIEELAREPGMTLVRLSLSNNFGICLNTKAAPTDDVHVRKAMAYALDYQTVITNIYPGSTQPTGPIIRGLAGAALTEAEMPYTYNLEQAKAELEQSPYYDELMAGTLAIDLTWCTEGGAQQEKLALLMQAGLQAVGVKLNITGKPFATMMTDAQTVETTPNASFVEFAPPYLDGGSFLMSRYHSSSTGSWEQMEWLQNPEIDAMIEEAITISDEDTRNEMYRQISLKLVDLCPTVWMADLATSLVYRSDYVTTVPSAALYAAGEHFVYGMGYSNYYYDYRVK